jgi:hypothetical protein
VKAFIIVRDRVTYARQCLESLTAAGLDVCLADYGSTFPEAVQWLADCGVPVLRHGDGNPHSLWEWEPFRAECGTGQRYIVTDPDVIPSDDCPGDWVAYLNEVLDRFDRPKAGLGLRLDRIPEHYQRREQVLSWEARFWDTPLDAGVFESLTDTTLALYRPLGEHPEFSVNAVRTGPPYLADHLAWYEDFDDLSPELRHYYHHTDPGVTYWAPAGRSAWGN